MDIIIISEFCESFSKSDNDRFLYLAKMLADDHEVEIITSSFRHTTKSQRTKPEKEWPFKITFINEPGYPKNVCLKRFWSHHVWGKNVEKYLITRKEPDVIYCAVPSLTGPNLTAKYCEKRHVPFIIDVQDLWPEAFQMIICIPVFSSIVFSPFKALANGVYKRADAICAVSDTYCKRALSVNQKCGGATTVFLGTQLSTFDRYASEKPIFEKPENEIWLGYCGTLGSSYDLTCVIDAMSILDDQRVRLIVMGDGPREEEFKEKAKQKGVNATFTGRLQYNQMCSLLCECDITVNPITHNAAQSIINKHADYAASGLPVLSTQECAEYRELVNQYEMGFNCKNNDANDLAGRLHQLLQSQKLRVQLGQNARKCAEERFDRKKCYQLLTTMITANNRTEKTH